MCYVSEQRVYFPVRLSAGGLAALTRIANEHFDGNRSAALRTLLRLGLASWDRGNR
jgi:hypothetical protein